ncbi:MAG: DUF881 domain-containing protein [Anaerolineae bacterium]
MSDRGWLAVLALAVLALVAVLVLTVRVHSLPGAALAPDGEDWTYVVADLIDSNARLREEIDALENQLEALEDVERGGAILQSLVSEVNQLRIANGLVEVSGPGIEIVVIGPLSVLDLHDLLNELRNAGAEAIALNGRRLAVWSAISTDGSHVTVDGVPVQSPYRLEAIGHGQTLEAAINRPGGLVYWLEEAGRGISVTVEQRQKITLPVVDQPFEFAYAQAVEE